MEIATPWVARHGQPGQFVIVIPTPDGERIPLTICDIDKTKQSLTIVFQVVGETTQKLAELATGQSLYTVVGPLGQIAECIKEYSDCPTNVKRILFVAGGVGTAPVYPQAKWAFENRIHCDVIIGARTKELIFFEERMRKVCDNLFVMTDDGSFGEKGLVTNKIDQLLSNGESYSMCVAIGPVPMMKYTAITTKKYGLKTVVSMNPLMVDGTGMCGACRITVDGQTKFTCVDGPEFDAHKVDFDEAMRHLARPDSKKYHIATAEEGHQCNLANAVAEQIDNDNKAVARQHPSEQYPEDRIKNFKEVTLGLSERQAVKEASRCLHCKKPVCVNHCPVNIQIPNFIQAVKEGKFREAGQIIAQDSSLPAICGRVCPQESQCEGACILGKKSQPIAIGLLERYVADWNRMNTDQEAEAIIKENSGKKVAIIGSGPSGLACANDLAKEGFDVTIFEALHKAGGVLTYGIPEFRLPKNDVVEPEIDNLRKLGVTIKTNVIIGKSITIDELFEKKGFEAIYIASGAGLPKFMGIPGENLVGVISANELLTRTNLMHGYSEEYDTPIFLGRRVAIVGGGNVAMDAARTARRLGCEVMVIYRRDENDMPARKEEILHAKQEGIEFVFKTNPVAVVDDGRGNVGAVKCIRMSMGEPDETGRRSFAPIEDSEYEIEIDNLVIALGTSSNPLIRLTTPGLDFDKRGCIVTNESCATSRNGIYAGGDAVSGAATVILAMGAGRRAAKSIIEKLTN